jgi:CubicO group peptidase (beta-lactamase class C family)
MQTTSRRVLLFGAIAIGCAVALASAARAGTTPMPWVARHGLSAAEYQQAFDDFGKDGFRLVAVSGYVENGKLLYAALWRKFSQGVPWAARHGLNAADFQKAVDDLGKQGLHLVYVDGYEYQGVPLFAGIWQSASGPAPVVKTGMDSTQYQAEFDTLGKQGMRLAHVSGYAQGGSARFAAIWDHSAGPAYIARHNLTSEDYQKDFDEYGKQGFRLKEVSGYSPGGTDRYAAIWEKGGDGAPWIAHHGAAVASYQTQFDVDRYQGYQPLYVQAFTSGTTARFNTIWESPFSAKDLAAITNGLAGAAKTIPVAGLSVAIARNGRLIYATGVGLADKENGVAMNVHHRLRIGSVSKTTTSVGIFRLIQEGATFNGNQKLTLDSPVFGPGGILSDVAVPALLAPLKDARVHHFLEHTSGIPDNAGDPVHCASGNLDNRIAYQLAQIQAVDAASKDPVGPVPRPPGTKFNYSNLNFQIMQAVIERVSGQSYQDHMLKDVFLPAGLTAPRLFHIGPYDPSTGEAKHYLVNGAYAEYAPSATCDMLPPGVGAGGWAMSAKDLLQYLAHVDGIKTDIVTAATRSDMLHRPIQDDPSNAALDFRYARGWITQNWGACNDGWNIVQGHNGGLSGAFSNMFFLQEGDFSFVVIGNQDPPSQGMCQPSTVIGKPKPAPVACGGSGQPFCGDEATARVMDLIRTVDWPNYDLF